MRSQANSPVTAERFAHNSVAEYRQPLLQGSGACQVALRGRELGFAATPQDRAVAGWRLVTTYIKTMSYFCLGDALAMCRRVPQTRIAPEWSSHVPGNAVNFNSLNSLHKLARELHYVAPWHCIAGVTKSKPVESRGRKTSGLKATRPTTAELPGLSHRLVS